MITRLEIDGFKSFADFAVDVPAFVAVIGPNASGKSNIFDAMALLTRAVTMPVAEALANGRGEPEEQFRRLGDGNRSRRMSFAVDLLLDTRVEDAFGSAEALPHTRLRYELVIEMRSDDRGGVPRPFVAQEAVEAITRDADGWARQVSESFADAHLLYDASGWTPLATEERAGKPVFRLERRSTASARSGDPRIIPAGHATATVLSSVTTAFEFPLLFAVRREIERWRVLHLEPSALRLSSLTSFPGDHLRGDGANLAGMLQLIRRSSEVTGSAGLTVLAADLARIIRGFSEVDVVPTSIARDQWQLVLRTSDEGPVTARVASDGTLRLVALLTALYEPDTPGVLCFEEPENGINPQRLNAMLDVLRDLVTNPTSDEHSNEDELVQLILSSHSPVLPLRMEPEELLVVDTVSLVEASVGASRVTRARRIVRDREQMALPGEAGWSPIPPHQRHWLSGITPEDAQQIVNAG